MPTPCGLKHLCSIRALVPCLAFFLSLSLRLILWSAGTHRAHSPAQASKTLLRRRTVPSPRSRGCQVPSWATQALCQRALLVFCLNQGISASFSLSFTLSSTLEHQVPVQKGPQHVVTEEFTQTKQQLGPSHHYPFPRLFQLAPTFVSFHLCWS